MRFALRRLRDRTPPNHVYRVEPTARVYVVRGDLWDHLYDRAVGRGRVLLPLTLEMGSWSWLRKNPMQRCRGVAASAPAWTSFDDGVRCELERAACREWY